MYGAFADPEIVCVFKRIFGSEALDPLLIKLLEIHRRQHVYGRGRPPVAAAAA